MARFRAPSVSSSDGSVTQENGQDNPVLPSTPVSVMSLVSCMVHLTVIIAGSTTRTSHKCPPSRKLGLYKIHL